MRAIFFGLLLASCSPKTMFAPKFKKGQCLVDRSVARFGVPWEYKFLIAHSDIDVYVICQTSPTEQYWYGCRLTSAFNWVEQRHSPIDCPNIPFKDEAWEQYYKSQTY